MSQYGVSKIARCTMAAALALSATSCTTLRTATTHLWSFSETPAAPVPLGPGTSRLAASSAGRTPVRGTDALPNGLRAEALIALGGLGRGSARAPFAVEIAAANHDWTDGDSSATTVVRATVTLQRRIVAQDGTRTAVEPLVGLLARELSRDGKLTPGTPIQVVYRQREQRCARHVDASVRSDSHAEPCNSPADGKREIAAVQIGTGLTARRAFYVRDDARGVSGFYTRDGRPLERTRLRYPVEHMLVTSGYSSGRPHPILKRRKPHYAIDFAAPRGTPVVSIGEGEVVDAGWAGQYGRQVSVRHADGTVAGYSHLERIAPGLVHGAPVRKGEIIGAVGSSGLATGPHLHFSLVRDGKFVNPATALAPAAPLLSGPALQAIHAIAAESNVALALAAREDAVLAKAKVKGTQIARRR